MFLEPPLKKYEYVKLEDLTEDEKKLVKETKSKQTGKVVQKWCIVDSGNFLLGNLEKNQADFLFKLLNETIF